MLGTLFGFTRNIHLAALIISYGLILFFLIIPFQSILLDAGMDGVSRIRFLLPIFFLVFVTGVWWLIKRLERPARITRILNLLALSTLILPLFQISSYLVNIIPSRVNQVAPVTPMSSTLLNTSDIKRFPDVYYIILDAHGRSDEIKEDFGYDNTQTLEQLTEMGFYIAQCSNANYPDATWQSMFAALNMKFFDHDQTRTQPPAKTINDGQYGIKNNEVLKKFESFGYEFIAFNTMYDFLNFTDADIYHDFVYFPGSNIRLLNKFESQLLKEIPIGSLINDDVSTQRIHYMNVWQVLRRLPQIPQGVSSPKFTYAHIMVPHFPYVFSPQGEYLAENQDEFTAQKYVDQVAFIDEQIIAIAEQIIENSPTPPIIIIQGDHGVPASSIQSESIGDRPGILNAYYLPGINYSESLYPTISPVNSFRLIFNLYFDGNMSLLPDDIYRDNLGSDKEHKNSNIPYDFIAYTPQDNCLAENR
jgi:hypothetical protein